MPAVLSVSAVPNLPTVLSVAAVPRMSAVPGRVETDETES